MTTRPIRSCVGSEHDNRIATSHPSVDVAHIDLAENWIGIRGERVSHCWTCFGFLLRKFQPP